MAFEDLATDAACTKGGLPDRSQYDIHCPLMGGPSYKLNYVSAGCIERQAFAGCADKECQHRVKVRKIKKISIKPEPVFKAEDYMGVKPVKVCGECKEMRPITARGLCGRCYFRVKAAGVLDEKYPSKRPQVGTATKKPAAKKKAPATAPAKLPPVFSEATSPVETSPATGFRPARVLLTFNDRDTALLDHISVWAAGERRSVEDQIMSILDRTIDSRINGAAS